MAWSWDSWKRDATVAWSCHSAKTSPAEKNGTWRMSEKVGAVDVQVIQGVYPGYVCLPPGSAL